MPKSENPKLGELHCPGCDQTATVFLQKGRNRKGYFKCGCYEKAILTVEKTEQFFPAAVASVAKPEAKADEPSTSDKAGDNAAAEDGSEPATASEHSGTDWGVGTAW